MGLTRWVLTKKWNRPIYSKPNWVEKWILRDVDNLRRSFTQDEILQAGRKRWWINWGPAKCAQCKTTSNLQLDHIKPLKRGGTNHRSNLQLLCKSCNLHKGAKW